MKKFSELDLIKNENAQHHLIAVCMRGYGYSSYENPISTSKELAYDLKLLMEERFQCESYYILAHSSGCFAGIELSLLVQTKQNKSFKNSALILCNPLPPNGWGHRYDHKVKTKEDVIKFVPFTDFRFQMISKLDIDMY